MFLVTKVETLLLVIIFKALVPTVAQVKVTIGDAAKILIFTIEVFITVVNALAVVITITVV